MNHWSVRVLAILATIGSVFAADTPTIRDIVVEGNVTIPNTAILNALPYKVGGPYAERDSGHAIKQVDGLKAFKRIEIQKDSFPDNSVTLYVVVEEKKVLTEIVLEGNSGLKTEKILDEIKSTEVKSIDDDGARQLIAAIQKAYKEENYHHVEIAYKIIADPEHEHKASVVFTIAEGKKSRLRTIRFKGNKAFEGRVLRNSIPSREASLIGVFTGAGKYDPDMVDADKAYIEAFYRNHGYITAQVTDSNINFSDNSDINITYTIHEGEIFTISKIDIDTDPNNEVDHAALVRMFTLRPGDEYCADKIRKMMETFKAIWGEIGYIDADVHPQIIPNEEEKTVDVFFSVEKGKRWRLNRINITGNKTTKDKVIRRQIIMEEGDVITTSKLDQSKRNVEYLSYFDQKEGVNWKKHRIDDGIIDLELNVKETPVRNLSFGLTYGPSKGSPESGVRGMCDFDLKNIYGNGWDLGLRAEVTQRHIHQATINLFDPYLFDTNISGGLALSYQKDEYSQWSNYSPMPREEITAGVFSFGIPLPTIDRKTALQIEFGLQNINNNNQLLADGTRNIKPRAGNFSGDLAMMQTIINQKFIPGTLQWFGIHLVKDTRNHKVYPNDGYRIALTNKIAAPGINGTFSFIKSELKSSWYTPLIGINDLVLGLHASGGLVRKLDSTQRIPYRELFQKGGQDSIRGFEWGEAGPSWTGTNRSTDNDWRGLPMGGRDAVQFNAELIFPMFGNKDIKCHLFYDSGCAWNTVKDDLPTESHSNVLKNSFNMRHTIGFGVSMMRPQPMKISVGYKLDRNKKLGESPHKFDIGMNMAF